MVGQDLDTSCHRIRPEARVRGRAHLRRARRPTASTVGGDLESGPRVIDDRGRRSRSPGLPAPLRGRVVGVLVCYLQTPPRPTCSRRLPTFAAHAAVAIGNCRALQQIQLLHSQLELERDYLREAAEFVPRERHRRRERVAAPCTTPIDLVAPTDATVPILGESGTGRELMREPFTSGVRAPVAPS